MVPSRKRKSISTVLLFFAIAFSASSALAQDKSSTDGQQTSSDSPSSSSPPSASASASASKTTPGKSTKVTNTGIVITPTGDVVTSASAPAIQITASATGPTAAASGPPKVPVLGKYPPPTVPPTANAPYMQKSNLPEGTVFIAVGACLGFLGLAVLAWRGLVAWSLHRSVKRAAMQQNLADSKAMLRPPGGGFYADGAGSSLSLDHLSTGGKGHHGGKGHTPNSSLFFSPTANTGTSLNQPGNRGSAYLPAGYYAAGNSAPGGGTGMAHIGGGIPGLPTLGPQAHGYSHPPGSPSLPPSRGGETGHSRGPLRGGTSMSSLNLAAAPQERAPSAYLEDLFENHQPGQVPQFPGQANSRYH